MARDVFSSDTAGRSRSGPDQERRLAMGKGNNAQKNDKKNKKPKQEKAKTAVKK